MRRDSEIELAERIMDLSESAMFIFNPDDFNIIYCNPKAEDIFGETLGEMTCYEGVETKLRPCMDCPFSILQDGQERIMERYLESFDMKVKLRANGLTWADGKRVILCTVSDSDVLLQKKLEQDIEQKKLYEEQLRLSGELYRSVVSQLKTIVFEYNYIKDTFYTSPLFQEKFGIDTIRELDFTLDENTKKLIFPEDMDIYRMLFSDRTDDFREITCRMNEVSGRTAWYRISIQFFYNEKGEPVRAIGTLKDEDEMMKSHETLRYRSEYDILTNILNVNRFYIDAGRMIIDNADRNYAVVAFDIDKFKLINDLFGMNTGNLVLKHVAHVLEEQLGTDAIYCRVHSDVFFLCMEYHTRGEVIKRIEKLRKGIDHNEFSFDINTSFGIYLVNDRSTPINLMCDRASLAGRIVKANAMKFCSFYDEQYRVEMIKTKDIEQDMNRAILERQFLMYLQPKYELATGEICGAEVLCRWLHPIKGLIQPNDFIPLFERNGFILKLDQYMWEEACRTLSGWRDEGKKPVPLSVNISRYHIKNNNLIRAWKKLIQKYDIPSSYLTLEITETFFHESDEMYAILKQLQDMGFQLEVDDFGSGYSSLNMIRHVPVDTIKIDKDFLDKKLSTDKGKIVVNHTIAMAKDLKLRVVAEGVETEEHVEFLKSSSCDVAQGYYFARPMPLEDFNRLCFGDE